MRPLRSRFHFSINDSGIVPKRVRHLLCFLGRIRSGAQAKSAAIRLPGNRPSRNRPHAAPGSRYSVSRAWGVMPSEIFRFPFKQRSSSIMAFSSSGSRMRSW